MFQTIADLREFLSQPNGFIETKLDDVAIGGDAETLQVGDRTLHLGENGLGAVSDLLGGPGGAYLNKLNSDLRLGLLQFHLGKAAGASAIIEAHDEEVIGLWRADRDLIPRGEVVAAVERAVGSDAKVRSDYIERGGIKFDVVISGLEVEPVVGDLCEGGISAYAHVSPARGKHQQPWVASYIERYACTNGMRKREVEGNIELRGTTVPQILEEMEQAARRLMQDVVPARLDQLKHLAEEKVKSAERYARQLCRENGIATKIEDVALAHISALKPPISRYDIVNVITELQHSTDKRRVPQQQRDRLQALGGEAIAEVEKRCPQCLAVVAHA